MINRTLATGMFLVLLTTVAPAADGTNLGDLAESMAPGTWQELPTNGLTQALNAPSTSGSAGHIAAFAHEFMWDPNSRKAFFIGGDHDGGPEKFIEYDTVTNSWTEKPRPFWMVAFENQNHSYSYMAMDLRGRFWYQDTEYDVESESWVDHGDSGQHFTSTGRARRAYGYLAGLGTVLYMEGAIYIWDEDGSGPWREVRPRFALGSNDTYRHVVAVGNPVTDKVLFGGGDSSDQLWLIDQDENITTLGPTPLSQISNSGDDTSIVTVDPVTGFFIVLSSSGELWEFDAENDRWTSISQSTPIGSADPDEWQNSTLGATNTTYNVSIYVQWIDGGPTSKMWVYKHSPTEPVIRIRPLDDLSAP